LRGWLLELYVANGLEHDCGEWASRRGRERRTLRFVVGDHDDPSTFDAVRRHRVSTYAQHGSDLYEKHPALLRACKHAAIRIITDDETANVPWTILSMGRYADYVPSDALSSRRPALAYYWIRLANGTISLRDRGYASTAEHAAEARVRMRLYDGRSQQFSSTLDQLPSDLAANMQRLVDRGR
jgi:hypothetical protein